MHINTGPGQILRNDVFEGHLHRAAHIALHGHAPVTRQIPLGEQRQLAVQQGLAVGWQHMGFGRQLPGDEGVYSLQVHRIVGLRVPAVDHLHHGLITQVTEQHEAIGLVPCQYLWDVQTRLRHEAGHLHKWPAVFFVRRCVHDDAAADKRIA